MGTACQEEGRACAEAEGCANSLVCSEFICGGRLLHERWGIGWEVELQRCPESGRMAGTDGQ